MKYIKLYKSHSQFVEPDVIPNLNYCIQENEVHYNIPIHDYSLDYLTFDVIDSGTITIINNNTAMNKTISYSTDNGLIWNSLTTSTTSQTIGTFNKGDKILFKGENPGYRHWNMSYYNYFGGSAKINVCGNIMSLIYGDDFINKQLTVGTHESGHNNEAFGNLFYNHKNLINAKNLILPNKLSIGCFENMFYGCSNLITTPVLSAKTAQQSCYRGMFCGCTSLLIAPELPATDVYNDAYEEMFYGCTNLIVAPKLPATTFGTSAYSFMFRNCTSLEIAPELPAETLTRSCYYCMFSGCTNLKYIKCLATDISASSCLTDWVYNVPATGTFVKSASMNDWPTGRSGIPTGWVIETETAAA